MGRGSRRRRSGSRRGRPPQPKGRPTVGHRQRSAAARARARRRRLVTRLWWAVGLLVFLGVLAVLVVTGTGAAPG